MNEAPVFSDFSIQRPEDCKGARAFGLFKA